MANLVDEEVNDFSEVAFAEASVSFECGLFKQAKAAP